MNILPTDPTTGQQQDPLHALGDLFSGTNRPALNSMVATAQARNGLVSAQTQEAMIKAQQAQEDEQARADLPNQLVAANPGMKQSEAQLFSTILGHITGGAENATKIVGALKGAYGATSAEQLQGETIATGKPPGPVTVPGNYMLAPSSPYANVPVQQNPEAQAQTSEYGALAGLNQHKDVTPQDFRNPSVFGQTSPEGQAALTKAVQEGRLDPTRLNARTAPILAQIELGAPGTNFNRLHADATLQANATFQQRAMSVDMLPGLLSHVTALGKALNDGTGYSDVKTVGQMQQFMNGQLNDPAYTEYMTARNDTLLRLASVMRGTGMSDQAHTAEIEAMSPTLAPYALDAWMKGQMSVVKPLLERQNRITHLGESGQGTSPLGAQGAVAPAPPAPTPLSQSVPTQQGAAPTPSSGLPSYPNEAAALAAGHKPGDRVFLVDHNSAGTL
jgi:hypothetical protein